MTCINYRKQVNLRGDIIFFLMWDVVSVNLIMLPALASIMLCINSHRCLADLLQPLSLLSLNVTTFQGKAVCS